MTTLFPEHALATLLGAGIAFVAIGIGRVLLGRPVVSAEPDPTTNPEAEDD